MVPEAGGEPALGLSLTGFQIPLPGERGRVDRWQGSGPLAIRIEHSGDPIGGGRRGVQEVTAIDGAGADAPRPWPTRGWATEWARLVANLATPLTLPH